LDLDFIKMVNTNMNSDNNNNSNSFQYDHPPLPSEPAGLYDTLITDADMAYMKKKFVKVTSSGQVEMNPDIVEFCIKITTNKDDATKGRESVKKRKDFILAALKKFGITDDNILASTIVKRVPHPIVGPDPDDLFLQEAQEMAYALRRERMHSNRGLQDDKAGDNQHKDDLEKKSLVYFEELCVKCGSLVQYLKVFSICNEKLDRHVEISRPVVRFSPICLQSSTQLAVRQAMAQAIQKANDLISTSKPRVSLGRLYYSVEDSLQIEPIPDFEPNDAFETFSWKRLNKMVVCSLTSCFELDHPKPMRRMI